MVKPTNGYEHWMYGEERDSYIPPTQEYPLYTHYASCPTARYVGGVSKYLCECPQPEQCAGVRKVREEEQQQQTQEKGE